MNIANQCGDLACFVFVSVFAQCRDDTRQEWVQIKMWRWRFIRQSSEANCISTLHSLNILHKDNTFYKKALLTFWHTAFKSVHTAFKSVHTTFKSEHTTFKSVHTSFKSEHTTFKSVHTTFKSEHTTLKCARYIKSVQLCTLLLKVFTLLLKVCSLLLKVNTPQTAQWSRMFICHPWKAAALRIRVTHSLSRCNVSINALSAIVCTFCHCTSALFHCFAPLSIAPLHCTAIAIALFHCNYAPFHRIVSFDHCTVSINAHSALASSSIAIAIVALLSRIIIFTNIAIYPLS